MSTVSNSAEQCQTVSTVSPVSTVSTVIARCYLHLRWYFWFVWNDYSLYVISTMSNSVEQCQQCEQCELNSVNSYSAVLPPSPMVFLITESSLSSMYHLLIVHGQTPSIPSSRILGGQHPALLSNRSRKPLRVERTSPLTHSGATWGYLCTQLFAQEQLKILKYCKVLYNKVSNIWNNFIFQNICSNNALPRNNSKLGKVHLTTRLKPLEPEQIPYKSPISQFQALHLAARKGDNDLVKLFIESGTRVDTQNVSIYFYHYSFNMKNGRHTSILSGGMV